MTRQTRPTFTASAPRASRRVTRKLALPALAATAGLLLMMGQTASAGIVPTVGLGTAATYSVLAGSTVTNTGPSVLGEGLALDPGTAVVGFPPGTVLGTSEIANGVSLQAQSDLTTAYNDAAGRGVEFTQTNPDLVGQTLIPGVYAASAKAPLSLSGQLVLDGQNNPSAVFIFQTDSSLITGPGSSIELINCASECNVFWQVGSSATLATGSVFVGNILALTSISVQTGAVVHGRALARNGAVTLDNDVFTAPSCIGSTLTQAPPTTVAAGTATTVAAAPETTVAPAATVAPVDTTPFNVTDISLPRTGANSVGTTPLFGVAAILAGVTALVIARRRRPVA
ncbi:MAG: ice-binding family protein [Ilumatobacteraceae bacterium]